MTASRLPLIMNFVAFQLSWFAAVLSAAAGQPLAGVAVVGAAVAWHLWQSCQPAAEAVLLALCGLAGGAWDSVLVAQGWVAYPSGMLLPWLAPFWIVAMWVSFATTLNLSLAWLKGRDLLAILLGAAGGPLAYLTGEKLGGIVLAEKASALVALGTGWALMLPMLTRLAERFDGVSSVEPQAAPTS